MLRGRRREKEICWEAAKAPAKGRTISLDTGKQAYSARMRMNMASRPYSQKKEKSWVMLLPHFWTPEKFVRVYAKKRKKMICEFSLTEKKLIGKIEKVKKVGEK